MKDLYRRKSTRKKLYKTIDIDALIEDDDIDIGTRALIQVIRAQTREINALKKSLSYINVHHI